MGVLTLFSFAAFVAQLSGSTEDEKKETRIGVVVCPEFKEVISIIIRIQILAYL